MSCWVVPAVAAELWGMSVEHVLGLIEEGKIPFKRDYHFMLVDVAPHSPTMEPPTPIAPLRARVVNPMIRQFDPTSGLGILPAPAPDDELDEGGGEYAGEYGGESDFEGESRLPAGVLLGERDTRGTHETRDTCVEECSWVRVRKQVGKRRIPPGG